MNRYTATVAACVLCAAVYIPVKLTATNTQQGSTYASGQLGIAEKAENEYLTQERDELRRLVKADLGALANISDLDKVKALLRHQAKFAKIEYHQYSTTKEDYRALPIYRNMRFGNVGHLCSGHADLFLGLLEIYGLTGRRIVGKSITPSHPDHERYRKTERYASHSTVEVLIGGRWILADPTYFMLPRLDGKYLSLQRALETLCSDSSTEFEFEVVAPESLFEHAYGANPNDYFRDLMFARVIVYKPFHKYPYDDVYRVWVKSMNGDREVKFDEAGCGITLANLTPPVVPWSALRRDHGHILPVSGKVSTASGVWR